MSINLLSNIISNTGIFLISFYILSKSTNYRVSFKQKTILIAWCFLWIILILYMMNLLPFPLLYTIIYWVSTILFLWKIFKIKLDTAASSYMLSYGLSYFLYSIAIILIGVIFAPFLGSSDYIQSPVDFNSPIYLLIYILNASLQFIIAHQIFKIKRFKNGFSFLLKKYAIIVTLIITGSIVIIASIISSPREIYDNNYTTFLVVLMVGIIITGIGMIIWIKRGITKYYIKKMKERSIEELEQELREKEEKIQSLTDLIDVLKVTHHKFVRRLSALENGVSGMVELIKNGKYSTEISEELAVTLEDILRLKQNYENDVSQINMEQPLPSTRIKGIDDMFRYFAQEYNDNNIDFNLKVNGSIPYLVENIIEQGKLETMIGDLLENALIAVNASDNTFRNVLAVINISENIYEFTVFDSGIPFESDTLNLLGKERATTHAGTGGSGIGFMTIFETMKECGASLIINQKMPSESDHTKSVTVRFDGENRYIVENHQ